MTRPTVLVFAGLDPSGGAGISADIEAIAAQGAHALPVVTALTVQDNERVFEVQPVDPALLARQARALVERCGIGAVKIGIPGSLENARAIAALVGELRERFPALPVVVDPVLASGRGDPLVRGEATRIAEILLAQATVAVPNLAEEAALCFDTVPHILVTGGHADGPLVVNRWRHAGSTRSWSWPRLDGEFHGSGCTLAAAVAGTLACGFDIEAALDQAQHYCQRALMQAFSIAPGQRIPMRGSSP